MRNKNLRTILLSLTLLFTLLLTPGCRGLGRAAWTAIEQATEQMVKIVNPPRPPSPEKRPSSILLDQGGEEGGKKALGEIGKCFDDISGRSVKDCEPALLIKGRNDSSDSARSGRSVR